VEELSGPTDDAIGVFEWETDQLKAHEVADAIREGRDQLTRLTGFPAPQQAPCLATSEGPRRFDGLLVEGPSQDPAHRGMPRRIHLAQHALIVGHLDSLEAVAVGEGDRVAKHRPAVGHPRDVDLPVAQAKDGRFSSPPREQWPHVLRLMVVVQVDRSIRHDPSEARLHRERDATPWSVVKAWSASMAPEGAKYSEYDGELGKLDASRNADRHFLKLRME
jgi:hypothetical protein